MQSQLFEKGSDFLLLQLEVLLVTLKIEGKLTEKIFDGHVAAEAEAFRIEGKPDTGTAEVFCQFQHLFFEYCQQFFVDSHDPLLQFEWRIFVVELDLVLALQTLLQVDEGVVSCRTKEVHHLSDGLPLLRRIEPETLLYNHTGVLSQGLAEFAPGVPALHLHDELLWHKIIISIESHNSAQISSEFTFPFIF